MRIIFTLILTGFALTHPAFAVNQPQLSPVPNRSVSLTSTSQPSAGVCQADELTLDPRSVETIIPPDTTVEIAVSVDCGEATSWKTKGMSPQGAIQAWTIIDTLETGEATHNDELQGAAFVNDHYYLSGQIQDGEQAGLSVIWVLNREGELVDTLIQPHGVQLWGLTWDGEWLWGVDGWQAYALTLEGEVARSWQIRAGRQSLTGKVIIWDTNDELFWFTKEINTDQFYGFNRNGQLVRTIDVAVEGEVLGGFYWSRDVNRCPIYYLSQHELDPWYLSRVGTDGAHQEVLRRMESMRIFGAFITKDYDFGSYNVLIFDKGMQGRRQALIYIYHLADRPWLTVQPDDGSVEANSNFDLFITLNSTDCEIGDTLRGEVDFQVGEAGGEDDVTLPITLIVGTPPPPPPEFSLLSPLNGDTLTALPLHGDNLSLAPIEFVWQSVNGFHSYRFVITAQDSSVSFSVRDTTLSLNLDTLGLPLTFNQSVIWRVTALSGETQVACNQSFHFHIAANGVDQSGIATPTEFALSAPYPNPFNSSTAIWFSLPEITEVQLGVFDLSGRRVASLVSGKLSEGEHTAVWNAEGFGAGVYFVKLQTPSSHAVRKIALTR